jgi:pyruvate/2-oxoglutarate dehydrogenase complex dihydrolipoamide dehydrogenase (E3) component
MALGMIRTPSNHNWEPLSEDLLLERVHPNNWQNPKADGPYDLVILGAGPAGLAAAELAITLRSKVAIVERDRLGGNSLNVGSIPSKALIRLARLCEASRASGEICVSPSGETCVEFGTVMGRMRRARTRIAEYHSVARLSEAGLHLFFGNARFTGTASLMVGDTELQFEKALIATGAHPRASDIGGLDEVGYRTSDSIFDMTELPPRLAVVGGGPLGCELAQAFCRLGSRVTILQSEPQFLPREERDAAELLSRSMAKDGVDIRLNTAVVSAHSKDGVKLLDTVSNELKTAMACEEVLLSIGRVPNVENLELANAGVEFDLEDGIRIDDLFCTANSRIYAAGDVCMTHRFANVAEMSARMAVHNALQGTLKRHSKLIIPWCTFCDPEIAHVGMQVWQARKQSIPVKTFTVMMQDVDRAITDVQDAGFVKIHLKEGTDKILGATIVASRASEMINEVSVMMNKEIGLLELTDILHTYPSQSEALRMAALAYERSLKTGQRAAGTDAAKLHQAPTRKI